MKKLNKKRKEAIRYVLIKNLIVKQYIIRSVLEEEAVLEEENISTVHFVNSLNRKDTIQNTVQKIIQYFNLTDLQAYFSKSSKIAFDYLRSQIENHNIFVLLAGNLGSYHTDIGTDVFRGYVLADTVAPFILINNHNVKTTWAFTLLHALVYLGSGKTGFGNFHFSDRSHGKFCNDVALKTLLFDTHKPPNKPIDLHKTKNTFSAYAGIKYRLGDSIVNLVDRAMAEDLLSASNASKVLNVAPRSVYTLLN